MATTTHQKLEPYDVVRARRFGRKTRRTYIIGRMAAEQMFALIGGGIAVFAHERNSGRHDEYMMLDGADMKVMGNVCDGYPPRSEA